MARNSATVPRVTDPFHQAWFEIKPIPDVYGRPCWVLIDKNSGGRMTLSRDELLGQVAGMLWANHLTYDAFWPKCSVSGCEREQHDNKSDLCFEHSIAAGELPNVKRPAVL